MNKHTTHTLHSFAKWLQTEIAELDGPDVPDIYDGAATTIREAPPPIARYVGAT